MLLKLTDEQRQRLQQLRRMTPAEWDAICKRCGVCCLIKIEGPAGRTLYLRRSCEHLNPQTRQCQIYDTRIESCCGDCLRVTPALMLRGGLLPDSCGYMEYVFGPAKHPAKVDFSTVCPISDRELDVMKYSDLRRYAITESVKWNVR